MWVPETSRHPALQWVSFARLSPFYFSMFHSEYEIVNQSNTGSSNPLHRIFLTHRLSWTSPLWWASSTRCVLRRGLALFVNPTPGLCIDNGSLFFSLCLCISYFYWHVRIIVDYLGMRCVVDCFWRGMCSANRKYDDLKFFEPNTCLHSPYFRRIIQSKKTPVSLSHNKHPLDTQRISMSYEACG